MSETALSDRYNSDMIAWATLRDASFDPRIAKFWAADFSSLQDLRLEHVQDWYAQSFYAGDAIIIVEGPKDMSSALRAVDFLLDGLDEKQPKASITPVQAFSPVAKTILVENSRATDVSILLATGLTGDARQREYEALFTAYEIGGDSESRLHRKLRDELRSTYTAFGQTIDYTRDTRLLAMGALVSPEQASEALAAANKAYDNLRDGGIETEAFDEIQTIYQDHFASILNEDSLPPHILMEALLDGQTPEFVKTFISKLDGLKRENVNEFMAEILPPSERITRIVVGANVESLNIQADCIIKQPADLALCK